MILIVELVVIFIWFFTCIRNLLAFFFCNYHRFGNLWSRIFHHWKTFFYPVRFTFFSCCSLNWLDKCLCFNACFLLAAAQICSHILLHVFVRSAAIIFDRILLFVKFLFYSIRSCFFVKTWIECSQIPIKRDVLLCFLNFTVSYKLLRRFLFLSSLKQSFTLLLFFLQYFLTHSFCFGFRTYIHHLWVYITFKFFEFRVFQ